MINWILNGIGIAIYFINRFANRKVKTVKASANYWLKDNWPELSSTLLINIALMILLLQQESQVNLDNSISEYIPFSLQLAIKPAMSLFLGLGLSALFYKFFRSKVKK